MLFFSQVGDVRLKAILALQKLYDREEFTGDMEALTERFKVGSQYFLSLVVHLLVPLHTSGCEGTPSDSCTCGHLRLPDTSTPLDTRHIY